MHCGWDIRNAFPSPTHECLDAYARRSSHPDDVELMCHSHRRARLYILGRGDVPLLLQAGSGSAQGDTNAAEEFVDVYNDLFDLAQDRLYAVAPEVYYNHPGPLHQRDH